MFLADRYAEMRSKTRVREGALFPLPHSPSELEVQARWFAGEFGRKFISTTGDEIEIVQFGVWNREAGPDFSDVAIRINDRPPITGCVELDLLDRSWETHGHATNPAFEGTVLHIFVEPSDRTFFTRTLTNRNVPQVRIDLTAFADAFTLNVPLAHAGRCQAPLRDLPEERVQSVLEGAARFRLQKKSARLRQNIDSRGKDEALFQEIAAALGYKENKLPFMLVAQRLPLKMLREEKESAEALLFGVAGFLQTSDLDIYERSTKTYVRNLWARWWPRRDDAERLILPPRVWHVSGTRPVNHPQRRLAALAFIAAQWPALRRAFDQKSVEHIRRFFDGLEHPYWSFHYTLMANPAAKGMAMVGDSRVAEILANVFFPLWLTADASLWSEYAKLSARLSNRRLETAATRLFGSGPRRAQFTKNIAQQQGLLQIYEDFCLQDNSDCAQCPFPEQMGKWG